MKKEIIEGGCTSPNPQSLGDSPPVTNPFSLKPWHVGLSLVVIILVVVFYYGLYGNPSYIPPVIINTPAPEIAAPVFYEGKAGTSAADAPPSPPREIRLSDYKGKIVVLNFWASWCVECALEHPSLLEINERYKDDPRFVMIGVNYQDKEDLARKYLQKHGNNFAHVRDISGKISIDYGIYGVPETFVIDKDGMIRHKSIGPIVGENYARFLENIIEPLLNDLPIKT